MKVVILAGGFGTRISEESRFHPKPMVQLGPMPILLHIMKHYYAYGYDDFVICAGYRQEVIKEYFANYLLNASDVRFRFSPEGSSMTLLRRPRENWTVTVIDTGLNTMTGGRLKRIRDYLGDEPFMLTYGDGVSDIDLRALETFHRAHGKLITISAYSTEQRFGVLDVATSGEVLSFREKIEGHSNLINIGYMVVQPAFIDLIDGDDIMLERGPIEAAANMGQLMAYVHSGFWQCMDTVREKELLEKLWYGGNAPWKVWKE